MVNSQEEILRWGGGRCCTEQHQRAKLSLGGGRWPPPRTAAGNLSVNCNWSLDCVLCHYNKSCSSLWDRFHYVCIGYVLKSYSNYGKPQSKMVLLPFAAGIIKRLHCARCFRLWLLVHTSPWLEKSKSLSFGREDRGEALISRLRRHRPFGSSS